jgi:hypothetical protein
LTGVAEQARLADTGDTLNNQRPARASPSRLERDLDLFQLYISVQQIGDRGLGDPTRLDRHPSRSPGDPSPHSLSVPDPKLLGPVRDAPAGRLSEDGDMSGTRRFVQTLELVVSGDTIEGRVRPERGESQAFSGWSELFALLQSMTSEVRRDSRGDEQKTEIILESLSIQDVGA